MTVAPSPERRDAVVVGGGLNGALCALALADAGLAVAVVDALDPASLGSEARDGRTTAIAFASARAFRRLGLWDEIAPEAGAIRDILCTDGRPRDRFRRGGAADAFLRFDARELGGDGALGYIVENRLLRRVLADAIRASNPVDLVAPAKCGGVEARGSSARVSLEDGRAFDASLVVAADGRRSRLRAAAGIKTIERRYGQTAFSLPVRLERDHEGIAHELFTPSGPFAVLPMAGRRASIVWSEKDAVSNAMADRGTAALERFLADRFGPMLGRVEIDGPVQRWPLTLVLATRMRAERLALLGDAAHGIHPIAGQGYNLGVKDVCVLAEEVGNAVAAGLDPGAPDVLARYERRRRFDNAAMAFGTDAINTLFGITWAPVARAREAGMALVNRTGPLRRFFMREAGGDVGALPALMREI